MSESAAGPLEPGRRFGDFDLIRRLGEGGGGEVWEARERRADRAVALKVLTRVRARSDDARARFEREARLAAGFRHPRVVYVLGAHEIEGLPCISMELMRGGTLSDLVEAGAPPVGEAVRLALDLLDGLEAAHDAGVLHRDVKPSNCFLEEGGRGAKLGDFGVSKVLEEASDLSVTGAFLGTFHYASPEQIRGDPLDPRSDLYSLGATLHRLLSGRRPFEGSPMAVAARILTEPPAAPSESNPEVPRALDKVVLRLLDKDPGRRYPDCASVRKALKPFGSRTGSSAPAGVPRRVAAYVIDFAPVALAMGLLTMLVPPLAPLVEADRGGWALAANLLFEAMLFVYFWACEVRWGRTLGKWIAGLRVEDRSGGRLGVAQGALRAGSLAAVWMALSGVDFAVDLPGSADMWAWAWVGVGAVLISVTMRRSNGWAAVHDTVSGSRVVRAAPVGPDAVRGRVPSLPLRPGVDDAGGPASIGSYEIRGVVWAAPEGSLLVGWDPRLQRAMWIRTYARATEAPDLARLRGVGRGRLPWLDGVRIDGRGGDAWDAFGAPAGCALLDWVETRGPRSWPETRDLLAGLATALRAHPEAAGEPVDLSRVWVEGPERVLLLDVPTRRRDRTPAPAHDEWMAAVGHYALEGAREAVPPGWDGPARPLSPRARTFLAGLVTPSGNPDLDARAAALDELRAPPLGPRKRRAVVLAGAAAPALFGLGLSAAIGVDFVRWISDPVPGYLAGFAEGDLDRLRGRDAGAWSSADRLRFARLTALHTRLGEGPEPPEELEHALGFEFEGLADPAWLDLRAGLDSLVATAAPVSESPDRPWRGWGRTVAMLIGAWVLLPVAIVVGAAGLAAAVLAVVTKGGPLLRGAGLVVLRERDGRAAGRLRCGLRTLVAWSPWIVGPLGGRWVLTRAPWLPEAWGFPAGVEGPAAFLLATTVTALVWSAALRLTLWSPDRGPAERLTGTVLAPR